MKLTEMPPEKLDELAKDLADLFRLTAKVDESLLKETAPKKE